MLSTTVLVLGLGAILMAASSLSMLAVRLTSSGLRGTGWLSAALAVGSFAAGLLLVPDVLCRVYLSDGALVLSFFLLRLAILQLKISRMPPLWHAILPIGLQWLIDLCCGGGLLPAYLRVVSLGILVASQTLLAAGNLRLVIAGPLRIPGFFLFNVLLAFAGLNLLRSALTPFLPPGALADRLNLAAFCVFPAVGLGLAFGLFWVSTAKLNAEAEQSASTDPLTRIYNRRHFLKWCEKELLRSQRSGMPFSVLMIDLDHFKSINDNFGHQRGDEVLCAAVERMQDSVRGIDVLCRWGGEEFAVLLPNAPADSTRIVAERIRENIVRMRAPLGAKVAEAQPATHLTASIGAATYSDLDDDVTSMLVRADRALYRAKQSGRNRVLVGA